MTLLTIVFSPSRTQTRGSTFSNKEFYISHGKDGGYDTVATPLTIVLLVRSVGAVRITHLCFQILLLRFKVVLSKFKDIL